MAQALNALSFCKVHKNQRDYCERERWFAFFQETKNMVKSYIFYSWFECQIFILEFNYYFSRKAKANSDLSKTRKEKQVLSCMVLWKGKEETYWRRHVSWSSFQNTENGHLAGVWASLAWAATGRVWLWMNTGNLSTFSDFPKPLQRLMLPATTATSLKLPSDWKNHRYFLLVVQASVCLPLPSGIWPEQHRPRSQTSKEN